MWAVLREKHRPGGKRSARLQFPCSGLTVGGRRHGKKPTSPPRMVTLLCTEGRTWWRPEELLPVWLRERGGGCLFCGTMAAGTEARTAPPEVSCASCLHRQPTALSARRGHCGSCVGILSFDANAGDLSAQSQIQSWWSQRVQPLLCVIYRFEVVKNTGADTPHDAELRTADPTPGSPAERQETPL